MTVAPPIQMQQLSIALLFFSESEVVICSLRGTLIALIHLHLASAVD